jgi:hypothetical protein
MIIIRSATTSTSASRAARGRLVEADELHQFVDAPRRHAHGLGGDGERLAAPAPAVLRRRVEQDPDAPAGAGQVALALAEDPGLPAVGLGQADEHSHRGGLAGTVGPRKPVTVPGSQRNVTSETTARAPCRLVSCSTVIMTAGSRRPA